ARGKQKQKRERPFPSLPPSLSERQTLLPTLPRWCGRPLSDEDPHSRPAAYRRNPDRARGRVRRALRQETEKGPDLQEAAPAAMAKKASEAHEKEAAAAAVSSLLKAAEADQLPHSIEDREAYFMQQVGEGEALAAQSVSSPAALQQAALCFYRALKVYPSPVELVMIYQKTLRKELFDLVMAIFSAEMKKKQDEYYESFPPRDMNVFAKEFEAGVSADGTKILRKGLTAARELKPGEVIYTEKPVVSCLQPALEVCAG
ncbi:MAG: hypothetical protein BJ554DRAFT_2277, partial [Olpidium bornovanus]